MTGIATLSNKNSSARLALGLPVIAALCFAGYWSVRLSCGDWLCRRNTLDSLSRAAFLDCGNAANHAWLAELQESSGQDPEPELRRAAELNPYASDVWIRLATRAEAAADFPAAETLFLKAAQVDRLFTPRWALMNFYFRRGDAPDFWLWTTRALPMSHDDLTPIFDLCWQFTNDAERIRHALPGDQRVMHEYLAFLIARNHLAEAGPIAAALSGRADLPILLRYCDRLLEQDQPTAAIEIWNRLCARRLLPYTPGLTNGGFAIPSLQSGFDWHLTTNPEITILQPAPGGGVQLSLNGKQPENVQLLWQWLQVDPHRRYRLMFDYEAPAVAGVCWMIGSAPLPPLSPTESWQPAEFRFTAADSPALRLALIYQRQPGTMRAEGTLRVRNLRLESAE